MDALGTIVFVIGVLVGLGCWIIILIDAFQDEIWKGIVMLLCGLYGLYYALFEFDHERKWLIVLGALLGSALGAVGKFVLSGPSGLT